MLGVHKVTTRLLRVKLCYLIRLIGTTHTSLYMSMYILIYIFVCVCIYIYIYRVSQEERSILWEVIVSVILSKTVYMNMCPIPNGFRDRAI